MTASQRRTVTVIVAALGVAFVLVWAATTGPEQLGVQQTESGTSQPAEVTRPQVDQDTVDRSENRGDAQPSRSDSLGGWLQDLAAFALVIASVCLAGLVLRHVFVQIGRRLGDERLVVPLEPLPDLDVARAAVERDQARQREALASSDVRNGIVACWVVFEEAAAESHVVKQPSETASAFVVRFLHQLDVDPRPVGELAKLFLEARFSSHPMPADARSRAEGALTAIHEDLARAGATS